MTWYLFGSNLVGAGLLGMVPIWVVGGGFHGTCLVLGRGGLCILLWYLFAPVISTFPELRGEAVGFVVVVIQLIMGMKYPVVTLMLRISQ